MISRRERESASRSLLEAIGHVEPLGYPCPCCGFPTLPEEEHYDDCYLCDWEDDQESRRSPSRPNVGPNGPISLNEARENFELYLTHHRPAAHKGFIEYFVPVREVRRLATEMMLAAMMRRVDAVVLLPLIADVRVALERCRRFYRKTCRETKTEEEIADS